MRFIDLDAQYRLIAADLAERFQRVHRHGRYVLGPEVEELEATLARRVGTRACVTVSSGTDALLLALLAHDIGPGDEVITSPFSFVAPAEAVALLGAQVVFADIDPRSYNLDPEAVEEVITPRSRAIVAVSLFGQCADFDRLGAIAERHGLTLIEDAAQSLGASCRGRQAGGLAHVGCTSFYPSKPLGCYGDGGACFTDDPDLAERLRRLRSHGQERPFRHVQLGINCRLDSLQAAVLLAKLPLLEQEAQARAGVAQHYSGALAELVTVPWIAPWNASAHSCYTIATPEREALREWLGRLDIPHTVYYPEPLHHQPALAAYTDPLAQLPHAEQCCREVLSLPIHPYLDRADQDRVIAAVRRFFADRSVSVDG